MGNSTLDTINIICASVLVALSLVDNITKKSYSNIPKKGRDVLDTILLHLKKFWIKIVVIIIIGIVTLQVNIKKNLNNDKEKTDAQKAFQTELSKHDAENQKKFNESLSKASGASASSTAKTMALYYLKYDSVQHKIEKSLNDTSKNKIQKPELTICGVEGKTSNDSLTVEVTLCAAQAPVYNLRLKNHYVFRGNNSNYNINALQWLPARKAQEFHGKILPNVVDKAITNSFYKSGLANEKPIVYIYLVGTYQNEAGKTFNYEELQYYNFSTQKQGDLTTDEYKWIYDYIKKQISNK